MRSSGYVKNGFTISNVLFVLPWPAEACAVCDSENGVAVRAGIFNSSFPLTLLEVLASCLVTGAVLLLLSRYLPE
jgi:hypothetical protein